MESVAGGKRRASDVHVFSCYDCFPRVRVQHVTVQEIM